MNYVAVLAATTPIQILAFVLMSNHVHFVMNGKQEDVFAFITNLKKTYSQYCSHKYSQKGLLLYNGVDAKELFRNDESLERAIAYVQMNPVAANICLNPSGYVWGTGDSFFTSSLTKGKNIGEMSLRARAKILHTRTLIPDNYIVNESGVVIPSSYVNVKFVEMLYRTPKRMNFFLNNSSKARHLKELPSFNDQLIASAIKSLCISMFKKTSLSELDELQQSEIIKQIIYRFSADPKQIARVVGFSYAFICKLLDRI